MYNVCGLLKIPSLPIEAKKKIKLNEIAKASCGNPLEQFDIFFSLSLTLLLDCKAKRN